MSRRPTQLPVGDARADLVAEWIGKHPDLCRVITDVPDLPEVAGWAPHILADALDRLVASGRLVEAADGVLCVLPRREEDR